MRASDLLRAALPRGSRRSGSLARLAASALIAFAIPVPAHAQHDKAAQRLSNKPIRFIVPFAPGGAMDRTASILSTALGERLGQTVVVDHRPGANGNIGSEIAARSEPGGDTILLGSPSLVINPSLAPLAFDPQKDLRGVAQIARGDIVLLAHPSLPAKTPADLVRLAHRPRGAVTFGSRGNGSQSHLAGEMLRQAVGGEFIHAPPGGSAPAMAGLLEGRSDILFDALPNALPHVKAGRIRALANASSRRSPFMPDLASLAESFSGVCIDSWQGILVPAATPVPIVERLHHAIAAVLALPDTKHRLAQIGLEAAGGKAEDFDRLMLIEYTRYAWLIRAANVRLD